MYRALRRTRVTSHTLSLPFFPIAVGTLALALSACDNEQPVVKPDAAFTPYIPAFTAGHIPARSAILVRIAEGLTYRDSSAEAVQELFDLDPDVEGTVTWSDRSTLSFQPTKRLEQNKTYTVNFHLNKLIEVPSNVLSLIHI